MFYKDFRVYTEGKISNYKQPNKKGNRSRKAYVSGQKLENEAISLHFSKYRAEEVSYHHVQIAVFKQTLKLALEIEIDIRCSFSRGKHPG